jgi:hypothetical protein
MDKARGYMNNPLRQNFFRAGHAHAGVIVILSLVCELLSGCGDTSCFAIVDCPNRSSAGRDPDLCRLFFSMLLPLLLNPAAP